jgi:hypothetical protein
MKDKQKSHWARVAFAARCARRVQPLFLEAWQEATAARKHTIDQAIELAERSAAQACACEGLKEAVLNASMTAGSAQRTHLVPLALRQPEAGPNSADASVVATFAAKAAENAAKAAMASAPLDGEAVNDAFHFAFESACAAGHPEIIGALRVEFEALKVVEPRTPSRPWWRFW